MKKFIAAVLSAAMTLSCMSFSVMAEPASTVYTIDTAAKTISKVTPLTTVATFKANITGAEVEVVNIDGTILSDSAFATENVLARIDDELYAINVKYPYSPIQTDGASLADEALIYNMAANEIVNESTTLSGGGFSNLQTYAKIGYGSDNTAPANTSSQVAKATKKTVNGETVYVMENDANNYVYLRSHYTTSAKYSTTLNNSIDSWTTNPIITTVEFEADKLGNISLFQNTPIRDGSKQPTKGDGGIDALIYSAELPYAANSVHFLEDGTVKLGGMYANYSTSLRTPIQQTNFTWEPGVKYTVSVVQRYLRGSRNGYVDAVYVNGTKIFPNDKTVGHADGRVALQADGSFKIGTRGSSYTHGGGLSSIMIGTAPKTADENFTVTLSDVKYYTSTAFNPAMDTPVSLPAAQNITVSEIDATVTDAVVETVNEFKAKYTDVAIQVYNADGTIATGEDNLETGMYVDIVSANGLQKNSYKIIAPAQVVVPTSSTYTIDADAKTISNVKPLTTVSAFLANFDDSEDYKVINIDGSEMSATAYATENVSLKISNGDIYKINVKYPYSPIQTTGSTLAENTEIYNMAANAIVNESTTLSDGGFSNLQTYAKIGYGSDKTAPANTEDQTVKATKKTVNGETVYVMENDSNNYAYLRSHYTTSAKYSTTLNNSIDSWTTNPIITTVEFEADKLGNISLFQNTPIRDGSKQPTKGDGGIDALIYSAELPYAANSVHFLEDGTVKLGGMYANYSTSLRTPIQETNFTWEPGVKYTVSVVQRYLRGSRNGYVDAVYVNGTKIFPNDKTVGHADGRVALQADGSFKIGTRGSSYTHGGGLSSIMIGTAPKTADENFTVTLSDVKYYTSTAFNPAMDTPIVLSSNNPLITIDNDSNTISYVGSFDAADIDTTAKFVVEGNTLKAVSADGLVAKTYKIVTDTVKTGFMTGVDGEVIESLADVDDKVCFTAYVEETAELAGEAPKVLLALYNNNQFVDFVEATGEIYEGEITEYNAEYDISEYVDRSKLELRGFVLNNYGLFKPMAERVVIK